jgi:SRSO17 transposase
MNPDHDSLTPSSTTKSQRLTPKLTLITTDTLDLLSLLLLPTLNILKVARNPLLLTTLMHKFSAVLLEYSNSIQRELAIGRNELRRARDDHWRDSLVGLEEVFNKLRGHSDQVGLDVFGVLDNGFRVDDGGEGLC